MPPARPIVFLSDFGIGSEWVGICHSVMAGISPESPIVDLSHAIRRLEVGSGALQLADCMVYIPENAVVLAVVDTVGKDREIAVETPTGRHLVGPDNGLLAGVERSRESPPPSRSAPSVIRPPHAESFRAPDTLCPATAQLAAGCRSSSSGRRSIRNAPGHQRSRAGGPAREDLLRDHRLQPLRQPAAQRARGSPRRGGAR